MPAVDLDALSKFVQKKAAYTSYVLPVLAGYGTGASLLRIAGGSSAHHLCGRYECRLLSGPADYPPVL